MKARPIMFGIAAGLLAAGAVLAIHGGRSPAKAVALAEEQGEVAELVIQYNLDAGPFVAPLYVRLLDVLGSRTRVIWVVSGEAELNDLRRRMGSAYPAGASRVVFAGNPVSTWAKDRFVTLGLPDGRSVLLAQARERTGQPIRENDQEVPHLVARAFPHDFDVRPTDLIFDGGDCLVTADRVLAHPALLDKNRSTPEELGRLFRESMGREVVWLDTDPATVPPHHVGVFLTVVGRTAVVGDLRLAQAIVPDPSSLLAAGGGRAPAEFCDALAGQLDHVAERMEELGYRVVRVPLLPSATPRAWVTYNNGLMETRDGQAFFYMPTFGAPALDQAAAAAFSAVGCQVIPINCSSVWPLGGTLQCLVNVVHRR